METDYTYNEFSKVQTKTKRRVRKRKRATLSANTAQSSQASASERSEEEGWISARRKKSTGLRKVERVDKILKSKEIVPTTK